MGVEINTTEMRIPVDDILCCINVTVIRSGDTLLDCSSNLYRQFFADNTPESNFLIPVDLPGPIAKITMNPLNVFVQVSMTATTLPLSPRSTSSTAVSPGGHRPTTTMMRS